MIWSDILRTAQGVGQLSIGKPKGKGLIYAGGCGRFNGKRYGTPRIKTHMIQVEGWGNSIYTE